MATNNDVPLKKRITLSFQQLSEGAARLNRASDDLAVAIEPLDAAFRLLNLGLTAWYKYDVDEDDSGEFWEHYVGYAKVDGKWGLALSEVTGTDIEMTDEHDNKEWLFNDAPRQMRVEAIPHIPSLLDKLVHEVNNAAASLEEKAAIARDVVSTIDAVTRKKPVTK